MKTSELIKKVNALSDDNSFMVIKQNHSTEVGIYEVSQQRVLIQVDGDKFAILVPDKFGIESRLAQIYELMFEYAKTPLEEREEEKKYRLHLPSGFAKRMGYLNFDKSKDEYFFADRSETCEIQTSFTQQEIDAMPFNPNYLSKEEV